MERREKVNGLNKVDLARDAWQTLRPTGASNIDKSVM
jgi:hypothetical protein